MIQAGEIAAVPEIKAWLSERPSCHCSILPSFRINTYLGSFCNSDFFPQIAPQVPQASPISLSDTVTPREYIRLSKNQLLFPSLSYLTLPASGLCCDFDS